MESMRESWTDKRLDDLNEKVDRGFERVDADINALRVESRAEFNALRVESRTEFTALRAEMKAGFAGIDERFEGIDQRFERIDERFEALYRLMLQLGGVAIAALLGLVATQL